MKKVLLVLFFVALTVGVNAQVRFGAKVGGTLSNITAKNDGKKVDATKAGIGFQLGGVLEYSFSESIALQPELLYVLNNVKVKDVAEGLSSKFVLQSIQLPVNFKYKFGVENLKFYATAGPYLGYIVSAKEKIKGTVEDEGIKFDINEDTDLFDKEKSDLELKHLDLGVGVGFGVEISKFTVGVGSQYGLANLTSRDKASFKLGTFNLSVGYFF
jgi:hypothetical protein